MADRDTTSRSDSAGTSLLGDSAGEVSPLELFFDLVFVFAVSQLSEHLASDLTWTGAGETLVLLAAVFSIWSFTSWGVSFPQGGRFEAHSIFVVLFVALFTNAAIPRAFEPDGWVFAVPFLLCLVGQTVFAYLTAGAQWLRHHYRAMLIWTIIQAICWLIGALVDPSARLAWWAVAVVLDIGGGWAGHPLPGRRFRSEKVQFEPARMVERSRLFLLIALGECVLTVGTAVAATPATLQGYVAATAGLISTTMLWFLYFRSSDPIINRSVDTATNPLGVARIAVNSQLVILAGLVALAVGNEHAIEGPLEHGGLALALALHLGLALYLAAQTWYLHALTSAWSIPRLVGIATLLALLPAAVAAPALVDVTFVAVLLITVVIGAGAAARRARRAESAAAATSGS